MLNFVSDPEPGRLPPSLNPSGTALTEAAPAAEGGAVMSGGE